ncbi:hypothetical protein BJY01DRAFT_227284 [Aspergillus pseudoustus]|uniref:Fungal-specific transcription factor domain-containing protein n=1 Tax=Aspergillus pseudoustus TaxID=1810923 RepID=A0ABR4IRT5_9EURO
MHRRSRGCYYDVRRKYGQLLAPSVTSSQTMQSLNPPFLGLRETCPVSFRWHMPRLIAHFYESLESSRVESSSESTAYKLQSTWFQHALSDPCLFHVTLYIGSSFFDIKSGNTPSTITLYHQTEIIRNVNERLSDPVLGVEDSTIASVALLALFSTLSGSHTTSQIHTAGLRRLIKLRGGHSKLGLDGLLATLIYTTEALQYIVFDLKSDLVPQGCHVVPPLGLESRILEYCALPYRILEARERSLVDSPSNYSDVTALFREIYEFKLDICPWGHSPRRTRKLKSHDHELLQTSPFLLINKDPIYYCCALAASIFWLLVDDSHVDSDIGLSLSTTKDTLDSMTRQLKDALSLVDDTAWLESTNPVVYCWVSMVGAAVARDSNLRAWLWVRQAKTMRVLDAVGDVAFLNDLWLHVVWLRGLVV